MKRIITFLFLCGIGLPVLAATSATQIGYRYCQYGFKQTITLTCDIAGNTLSCAYDEKIICHAGSSPFNTSTSWSNSLQDVWFQSTDRVCARDSLNAMACWDITYNTIPYPTSMSLIFNNDLDGDGISNTSDNCLTTSNTNQLNTDGDAQGNVCDSDDDNDGVSDGSDKFPLDATETLDNDNDGIGNNADTDDDNDGMPDTWEILYGLNSLVNDANGDTDNDGFTNLKEFTNGTSPVVPNGVYASNFDGLNKTDDLVLTGPNIQVWPTANNIVSSYNCIDVLPESGSASLVATPDVNKDGINDMVFQTVGGGNIYSWIMSGSATGKTANWILSTPALVKGSGDFDNDGDGDLVLQNPSTGDVSVILLQNGLSVGFNWLGTFPTYEVKAVGDVNNDGTDDVILQDPLTDDIATLRISNGTLTEAKWQERFTNYKVIATGDANGDGTQDIYTATADGDLAVIPMLNGSYTGAYWLGAFTGYTPYAAADVDGDGLSDYVLQDAAGNIGSVTLTNTFAIKSAAWVGNWGSYVIKGALDTDGDLDADIVTQDGAGNVGIIEMENGLSVASRWIATRPNTVRVLPKTVP